MSVLFNKRFHLTLKKHIEIRHRDALHNILDIWLWWLSQPKRFLIPGLTDRPISLGWKFNHSLFCLSARSEWSRVRARWITIQKYGWGLSVSVGDKSVWVQHSGPRNGTYSGVGMILLPQEALILKAKLPHRRPAPLTSSSRHSPAARL